MERRGTTGPRPEKDRKRLVDPLGLDTSRAERGCGAKRREELEGGEGRAERSEAMLHWEREEEEEAEAEAHDAINAAIGGGGRR